MKSLNDVDSSNTAVIDIEEIKKAITYAQENYKVGEISQHVVLFWGYSGTGKSTSIITLNGQQMYAYNRLGTPILVNRISDEIMQESKYSVKIFI